MTTVFFIQIIHRTRQINLTVDLCYYDTTIIIQLRRDSTDLSKLNTDITLWLCLCLEWRSARPTDLPHLLPSTSRIRQSMGYSGPENPLKRSLVCLMEYNKLSNCHWYQDVSHCQNLVVILLGYRPPYRREGDLEAGSQCFFVVCWYWEVEYSVATMVTCSFRVETWLSWLVAWCLTSV